MAHLAFLSRPVVWTTARVAPALTLWLNRGGALALPIIRGGGERGEAWHRAAMREKRQVSYDDFLAVAQALQTSGFTSAQHLGVFGSSNGGIGNATVVVFVPIPPLYNHNVIVSF